MDLEPGNGLAEGLIEAVVEAIDLGVRLAAAVD
jgi:hypothetical protein